MFLASGIYVEHVLIGTFGVAGGVLSLLLLARLVRSQRVPATTCALALACSLLVVGSAQHLWNGDLLDADVVDVLVDPGFVAGYAPALVMAVVCLLFGRKEPA